MRVILFFTFFVLFYSCQQDYNEFKNVDNTFQYKLLMFDENQHSFNEGNFVRASIKLISGTDTIYDKDQFIPFDPTLSPFNNLITELNEGDSISFKVNSSFFKSKHFNVNFKENNSVLIGGLKIYEFLTINKSTKFFNQNDPEIVEQQLLKRYLKKYSLFNFKNGIYINTIQKGQGDTVGLGKTIKIKFRATFLDGIEFDNTYYNQYFEYTYGTPNQLIQGLDVALLGMKNKEKSKIIIPSQLAFGDKGSSTGIVPPFTTLVYDLEVMNIK